ncbi:Uncharacterised protein [Mycobacteroides abscessus subsp. abscessus]|uniref:hypothetical protein n=1 Tax=Mycobacteroides abscessus TaxID=36809 RepID=UPI0009260EE4|nr:hypothetical protein [Mycobacteroides abscessus]SIM05713.1 Uncharacterised protein [Mycobacteroides abscessus subsp. abscessus]SKT52682.1 Uncharacterised protein [Mycobacteroides abscessus subsp. massiliense]SLC77387.1 Uncharacterised protein [Mycobacteroides abscessus subsp. abscessus]
MSTAMAPHDTSRMRYARAAFLRAYEWQLELDVHARRIGSFNADVNLKEMRERWPTQAIVDWANRLGLEPIWSPLPPKLGAGFPQLKARLQYQCTQDGVFASTRYGCGEDQQHLYDADPNCRHLWMVRKWSGVECNDCDGWFCA